MSVLRRVFLPERPHWLPALLAAVIAMALNVMWIVNGSAWFAIGGWPFVWIWFSHIGLWLSNRKRNVNVNRTMLLLFLLATPLGCGDDEIPETMEQCFKHARQEYWSCHTAWLTREHVCVNDLHANNSTCELLFPFPSPPTKR